MDYNLTEYEKAVAAMAFALSIPAIHPDFEKLPLIMGTAGEMECVEDANKWFYKIPIKEDIPNCSHCDFTPCRCSKEKDGK